MTVTHISQSVNDILNHKPHVDTGRIAQAIQDEPNIMFLPETMEEVLELVRWLEKENEKKDQRIAELEKGVDT